MAQHFLLSKSAKTLSLASIFQMKDADAEIAFRRVRCAHISLGVLDRHDARLQKLLVALGLRTTGAFANI